MRQFATTSVMLLALVGLAGDAGQAQASQVISRSFTFSTDSTEAIITLEWVAGLSYDEGRYVVYGDGRFLHESRNWKGELQGSYETRLSFDEVQALFTIAVDRGVMDTEDSAIESRLIQLGRSEPRRTRFGSSDAGRSILTLKLTNYVYDGNSLGPVERSFTIGNLRYLRLVFPEVEEVAALADLSDRLGEIASQAERSRGE